MYFAKDYELNSQPLKHKHACSKGFLQKISNLGGM